MKFKHEHNSYKTDLQGGSLAEFIKNKGFTIADKQAEIYKGVPFYPSGSGGFPLDGLTTVSPTETVYKTKAGKFIYLKSFVHFNAHMNNWDSPIYEAEFKYLMRI